MKRIIFLICALTAMLMLSAHSAMATDANVTDAHFEQNGAAVHTLSNGNLDCIINASGTGNTAVMINAVYEKKSNKLVGVKYVSPTGNEFKSTIDVTDAQNTYVTMCVWDSLESANAKTQVYSIAAQDSAPENPWNVKVDNKGAIAFEWGACEDNLKTAGYRIYKNGEKIGETTETSFLDADAKWYESNKAEYKITAYDEYGNESDGTVLKDVSTDNSDIAAILFTQPNITEKMSLYFATGKETDNTWYGYNTAETKDGVPCRCIPSDSRAVFKYSTEFKNRIGDGERDAVIRITYYDDNTDAFRVSYVGKGARYTDITVDKINTNKWITKELRVSDFVAAYIDPVDGAKAQDENVDLSIWSKASTDKGDVVDTSTYISEIQVVLEGDAPEPQPTAEPGTTPKPTAEPMPVPTIDPADIKTVSVDFLNGQTTATCSESEYNLINIFWAGKNNDGQINSTGWYGYNYGTTQNGEKCRAIDDNKRLVLIYNDSLNAAIGSEPKKAKLRVKYLDNGTDKIRVSYISKSKRYTDLGIEKTDSGEWKWAEFTVTDLVKESDQQDGGKGGYQDGRVTDEGTLYPDGPNLTIWSRGSGESESVTEYISAFEIVFDDEEEPEPSIAPSDIDKASITFLKGQAADTCSESENNLISMYWGKDNAQITKEGWYAYTSGTETGGVECREVADNRRIVLMFSDALNEAIGDKARNAVIRVRYYDSGSDKIRVSYVGEKARYTTVTIQKTDTNTWQWAELNVSDLINKANDGTNTGLQDEQTYFSIWSRASGENETNNTTDYISAVELILNDGSPEE